MRLNHEAAHELVGQESILRYITGGNGIVTLKSHTGVHHTYLFQSPSDKEDKNRLLFVKTLVGGNNWVYVGMYKDKKFYLTKASRFQKNSDIVRGICYIVKLVNRPDYHDDRMQLFHEGVCSRCGRPLTNPESIEIGIGPTCRGML